MNIQGWFPLGLTGLISLQSKGLSRVFSNTNWKAVSLVQFSSVQSLGRVWLFVTPWTAACQASLFFTVSCSLLKLMSIELMMPSNRLILCCPLLLLSVAEHQCLFQWISSSHQVTKVLEFHLHHQSSQWIFRVYFLYDWLVWSPCCPRDSQESTPASQFKSIILPC